MKNSGAAMPNDVVKMVMRSNQEPRCVAANTPSGTAISRPISVAPVVSDRVIGMRWKISSVTGRPLVNDVPRSPCRTRPSQCQNCNRNGWSRPRRCRASSIAAADAFSPATISPTSTNMGTVETIRRPIYATAFMGRRGL